MSSKYRPRCCKHAWTASEVDACVCICVYKKKSIEDLRACVSSIAACDGTKCYAYLTSCNRLAVRALRSDGIQN